MSNRRAVILLVAGVFGLLNISPAIADDAAMPEAQAPTSAIEELAEPTQAPCAPRRPELVLGGMPASSVGVEDILFASPGIGPCLPTDTCVECCHKDFIECKKSCQRPNGVPDTGGYQCLLDCDWDHNFCVSSC